MTFRKSRLPVVLVVCTFWHTPASATEWFVAVGGSGSGTSAAPFGHIQEALNAAQAGDTVSVRPGTYREGFRTVRPGRAEQPIHLRAAGDRGSATVMTAGTVARIDHAYIVIEGLVMDGQYAAFDTVDVNNGADFLVLRNVEVRRSAKDLIDIGGPQGVLIENSLIHHALNAAQGRTDAHGIVAGPVRDLTIRDTEIHTFSGDAIQVDPARSAPGWTGVTVEGCRMWLAPLPAAENGFRAGTVPGENAIDTKASPSYARAKLVVRNSVASGFGGGLISNMAAFNIKEHVDALIDGVTVFDSEIAFRLRGPIPPVPGAWVTVQNAVVHDVKTAFRYENDIERLNVWNTTLGSGVERPFQAASSNSSGLDIRNLLVLGPLPTIARGASNLSVGADAFVNASAHDYALVAGSVAINSGVTIEGVSTDRVGTSRPQGTACDVGAFEWQQTQQPAGGDIVMHVSHYDSTILSEQP